MKKALVLLAAAALLCGCGAQKATTSTREDVSEMNVDEKVSFGYGEVSKKDNTTAISRVVANDNETTIYTNVYEYLEGKVAGVYVDPASGSIRIRGISSINGSNEPLFVVDGMVMDDISMLSPSEIYTVDVLKDSSSAMYGVRGANGVIVITTKAAANAQRLRDEERARIKAEKKAAKAAEKEAKKKNR